MADQATMINFSLCLIQDNLWYNIKCECYFQEKYRKVIHVVLNLTKTIQIARSQRNFHRFSELIVEKNKKASFAYATTIVHSKAHLC